MTLYDGNHCDVLAAENITLMDSSFNKYHLLKVQHYTL
jgi:hypothetical protein